MHQALRTTRARVAATATAVVLVGGTAATVATTAAEAGTTTTTTSAPKAAAGWLARQLVGAHHDHIAVTFGGKAYPDAGETADGVLAMDAAHVAQRAATRMTKWLQSHAKSYATGSNSTPGHYYPGNLAKLLLVAEAQHASVHSFGGIDLVKALRADEQADGSFANTADQQYGVSPIAQALALIALSHTGSIHDWPDAKAIAWLVGQQCGDGGFTAETQVTPAATCTDVDATAYAAQALLTVHSSAAGKAMHWLRVNRNDDGGYGLANGKASSNANSTAVAVQALRQARYGTAAPVKWLSSHQLRCKAAPSRRGAVKFQGSYEHDSAVRATTQAAQALALRWLGSATKTGADSAAPTLAC